MTFFFWKERLFSKKFHLSGVLLIRGPSYPGSYLSRVDHTVIRSFVRYLVVITYITFHHPSEHFANTSTTSPTANVNSSGIVALKGFVQIWRASKKKFVIRLLNFSRGSILESTSSWYNSIVIFEYLVSGAIIITFLFYARNGFMYVHTLFSLIFSMYTTNSKEQT